MALFTTVVKDKDLKPKDLLSDLESDKGRMFQVLKEILESKKVETFLVQSVNSMSGVSMVAANIGQQYNTALTQYANQQYQTGYFGGSRI